MPDLTWDVFVLYVLEDKAVANALARRLIAADLTVWFDEQTMLQSGDSLQRLIDEGLNHSRCGLVIVSPDFLSRCPASECNSLFSYQQYGSGTVLPIWHRVTEADLGGWSPFSKIGLFTSRGLDEVMQRILANTRDLPARPYSLLRFRDSINADPVTAKIVIARRLEEGEAVEVLWPTLFDTLLQHVEALKVDAERYYDVSSRFHGSPAEHVVNFLDTATRAISYSHTLRLNIPNRIHTLIEGMSEYWDGMTPLIERSVVNFLTLANFDAQFQLAYCFRYKSIASQMPPEWLRWFEPERSSLRRYAELFGIEEEMCSARVSTVSDVYINMYIWGPRSMLMEAACTPIDKPIANPWFVRHLIPQLELALIWDPGLPTIRYRERAVVTKVVSESGEELY